MTRAVARPASATPGVPTTARPAGARRRPRAGVHPWAWWAWALGAAVFTMLTTNLLVLVLVAAVVTWVVVARRTDAAWARSARSYAVLALVVVGVRLFFQVLLGGLRTGHVLFTLPTVQLPSWFAGEQLGGPVTVEALWYTLVDAGRLALLLWCVGAANSLANPRRALRNLPHGLHRLATAVVIAVSVAPQLVESTQRVRRARRLRGGSSSRRHAVRAVVVPVLEDAVERSMALAASMESRGFGRPNVPSRYRPDAWRRVDTLVALCGVLAVVAGVLLRHGDAEGFDPATTSVALPTLSAATVFAVFLLCVPAWATPRPAQEDS